MPIPVQFHSSYPQTVFSNRNNSIYLFITSFSTMELSTTMICSGILTLTATSPRENRESMATHWPPGPSMGNATMPSDDAFSSSLNEKLCGWSDFSASLSFSRNWKDSVQMVLGKRHVKTLHKTTEKHKSFKICSESYNYTGTKEPNSWSFILELVTKHTPHLLSQSFYYFQHIRCLCTV